METYVYWHILGFALAALELATGTFYLLICGVAVLGGGLAAWMGFSLSAQLATTAMLGFLGVLWLRRSKLAAPAQGGENFNFDVGQAVQVLSWHEDGSARVRYRGTEWDAKPASADTPHQETLFIKAVEGSVLILTPQKPEGE